MWAEFHHAGTFRGSDGEKKRRKWQNGAERKTKTKQHDKFRVGSTGAAVPPFHRVTCPHLFLRVRLRPPARSLSQPPDDMRSGGERAVAGKVGVMKAGVHFN